MSEDAPETINSDFKAVPASHYTYDELAHIYNEARTDYIIPMPMNAKRMQEYVEHYDIDLNGSFVASNRLGEACGVGMLGVRPGRCWITRLGVIPHRRLKGTAQFIMESMLEYGRERGATVAQLEVIVGNEPARALFEKMGFEPTRTLLIIRRPPGQPEPHAVYDEAEVTFIEQDAVFQYLQRRAEGASWVEETASLLNVRWLQGVEVTTVDGSSAWVVYQRLPFQLTHFVLSPDASDEAIRTALYHIHKLSPMQDTKIENVALYDHEWHIYQSMGYIEVFRRTEMILSLI